MKRILSVVTLIVASIIGIIYAFPGPALSALINIAEYRAGFADLTISTSEGYEVSYFDNQRKDKPTLILLHGITGLKENWLDISPLLKNYRIIAPDFLGHGKTMPQELTQEYQIEHYVSFLHSFLNAINVKKVTLVGNSLGGLVAGLYAYQQPNQVQKLILINNAGIDSKLKTPAFTQGMLGKNPYIIRSHHDFIKKLDLLFDTVPPMPASFVKHISELQISNTDLHQKLFDDLDKTSNIVGLLEPILNKITQKTLVIWGDKDEVMHLSSLEKMQHLLQHETIKIIKNCGHVPMVERPKETAALINAFLEIK